MARGVCNISLRPPIVPYRRMPAKEELHVGASNLVGVSGQAACRIAMGPFIINYLISLKMAIRWGSHPNLFMPKRKPCFPVMSCDTANPSAHTTISGYWVGPDTEDGWGYVEAAIHPSL